MTKLTADGILFCPWCGIGIDSDEASLGKCMNCENTWNPDEYLGRFEKSKQKINQAIAKANDEIDFYEFTEVEDFDDFGSLEYQKETCQEYIKRADRLKKQLENLNKVFDKYIE